MTSTTPFPGVCLARWESHYNSSALGTLNWDDSKDLGLFQISEKWWCEWGQRGKGCNMKCEGKETPGITSLQCLDFFFPRFLG